MRNFNSKNPSNKAIFLFAGIFLTLLVAAEKGFCDSARRPAVVISTVGGVMSYALGVRGSLSVAVYDGDTIFVAGHTIRLLGVDAPELEQFVEIKGRRVDAGQVAKQELIRRINSLYRISCVELEGHHRIASYDLHRAEYVARCLGSVRDNEGIENEIIVFEKARGSGTERVVDIGAWLVANGLAVATSYSTFSVKNHSPYEKIEETAREKEIGIWKKNIKGIVRPVDWRRAQYEKFQKARELEKKRRLDENFP